MSQAAKPSKGIILTTNPGQNAPAGHLALFASATAKGRPNISIRRNIAAGLFACGKSKCFIARRFWVAPFDHAILARSLHVSLAEIDGVASNKVTAVMIARMMPPRRWGPAKVSYCEQWNQAPEPAHTALQLVGQFHSTPSSAI